MAENEIVLSESALKSNDDILMYGVAASALSPRAGTFELAVVPEKTQGLLLRMFADPSSEWRCA